MIAKEIQELKNHIGPTERAAWRLTIIAQIAGIILRGIITATQIAIVAYVAYRLFNIH